MSAADRLILPRLREKFIKAPSGCWIWIGARVPDGYGQTWRDRRAVRAHRVIFEAVCGPVPAGLELDHLCHVRRCVNPLHLQPVDRTTNIIRSGAPLSQRNLKGTCRNGLHPWPAASGIRSGKRTCLECSRAASRRRNQRRRAATGANS